MGKFIIRNKTTIDRSSYLEGEPIEHKVERLTQTKEPINETSAIIHTNKKDGVLPGTNIRTDKWDVALEAMDIATKTQAAQHKGVVWIPEPPKDDNDDGGNEAA